MDHDAYLAEIAELYGLTLVEDQRQRAAGTAVAEKFASTTKPPSSNRAA